MDIYQHFRKDEQPFIDLVLGWIAQVERTFQPKLTDFLDPREQQIIEMLVGNSREELKLYQYGGAESAERKRVIIAPMYEEVNQEDYQLGLLQTAYNSKFVSLNHSDVMGAFLSLGIERKKMGDIFVGDNLVQIVLAEEIATFVIVNLTSIKNVNVRLEPKGISAAVQKKMNWTETEQTVSSLRLDAILKTIYHLSRKDASSLIAKGFVKVNFKVVEDNKFTVQAGDLISVRGKGRSKLVSVNGLTKKEKYRVTTAVLK